MARPSDLPLPTSHFSLPTSDFRLLTSNFRFPTSDFQLPTSEETLLFGSITARSATRVLMLKVKAQWKGRLYRSRHKREELNLLLKKQLSNFYQGRKYPLQSKTRKTLSWNILSHNAILHSRCSFIVSCTSFL